MTKEEYLAIEDEIQDINFKIYECTIELKGLKRFLDYLQNVYAKTDENAEAIKTTEEAIEKKETYIRLLKKERNYYQDYALYYLEFESEEKEQCQKDWEYMKSKGMEECYLLTGWCDND